MTQHCNYNFLRWIVWVLPLVICMAHPWGAKASQQTTYAAYTLLTSSNTGETVPMARVILHGASTACPKLIYGSNSITMSPRQNPNSVQFDVTVCEAFISFDQALTVTDSDITLQAVTSSPSKILVYGDTGCKVKDCPTGPATPFYSLACAGAWKSPDLILHMGDFNYRGTSSTVTIKGSNESFSVYDAGDDADSDSQCQLTSDYYSQNAADSSMPDNWTNWWNDFFFPAQDLLPTAPWIFARGNHELCSRAGPGWFYFLGPGSNLKGAGMAQMSCPNQGSLSKPDKNVMSHLLFVDPYIVQLKTLGVLVLDSANACDAHAPKPTRGKSSAEKYPLEIYQSQFNQIPKLITNSTQTWLMTHRPLWGIKKYEPKKNPPEVKAINQTLQKASKNKVPAKISLLLSGHMHTFETLSFTKETLPPQLITGNGGVKLSKSKHLPPTIPKNVALPHHGPTVEGGQVIKHHGYMAIDLATSSWTGTLWGMKKVKLAKCGSSLIPVCQVIGK